MKTFSLLLNRSILPALVLAGITNLHAQGTAFSYQGRLTDSGAPFNGNAEFLATLWSAANGGAALATNSPPGVIVSVTNGLFVLPLDFGANFPGGDRWLQLEVRTAIGPFTTLAPRQPITPTPYAITAITASNLTGTLSSANLGGSYSRTVTLDNPANTFAGNGSALTGINHLDSPGAGPARALAVDAAGYVGIGTNNSGAALQVAGGGVYANLVFRGAVVNNSAGVSNMASPVNVFIAGTRAYVASYQPGAVKIFDISNAFQPVLIGQAVDDAVNAASPFKKLAGLSGIFITNNIAYVTSEQEHALTIMDVSNPANPTKLAEVVNNVGGMTNLDTPTWVIVSGNRAYVAAFFSSAISVFDVSNPADPVLIRQVRDDSVQPGSPFTRLQWPYQMQLVGTRLYVAARGDHALNILDVSNPANPTLVNAIVDASVVPSSPFARLRNANWVEVLGNTAYVIAGAFSTTLGSLTIIDISNPASPVKLAEVNDDSVQTNSAFTKLSGAWAVKVVGDIAFVTSVFDNAVTAIDVSNPGNPRLLKEFVNGMEGINTLSFTEGLAARGETVYVAGGGSGALNMFSAHAMLGLKVDGFVGIGTATPRTELDVAGTVSARNVQWASGSQLVSDQGGSIELGDSSLANSTPYIDFHFGVNGAQNYNVRLINDAPSQLSLLGNFSVSGSGILDKADVNSGSISPGLIFGNASGEGIASKRTAGAGQWGLDFYTAFINRMTIANNGNVGIGTGSPQTRFHVFGADGLQLRLQNSVNNRFWTIYSESFNDSGNLLFVPGTGVFGYIRRTDGLYFSGSDEQLKREITPLSNVLDRVLQLRPVTYQFRGEPENTARTLGLIAQEVEPLFPEVVGEHAGTKSLAYSGLVPAAIGAIQELNQKLSEETSSLRERLARKEAEIAELHRAVAELAQLVQGKASK